MQRMVWATLVLFGCSGPDDREPAGQGGTQAGGTQAGGTQAGGTQAGGTQTGGTQAGGGGSSSGPAAGSAGESSCAERWSEYDGLAKAARLCDPGAATPQCKFNVVVLDACGCSVPANGSSTEYTLARLRLTPYIEDCEFPEQCATCPSTLDAACKDTGSGVSQCVYQ